MAGAHGGQALRFTTSNPFVVLDAVTEPHSDESGSTGSPTSSGGSMSQNSHASNGAPFGTPSRGSVMGAPPSIRALSVSRRWLRLHLRTVR
jgi:hypothetical protein